MSRVFFSHAWGADGSEHARVLVLARELRRRYNWDVWVDEDSGDMHGALDIALASAIDRSKIVTVCLTPAYVEKLDRDVSHGLIRENCRKEWEYTRLKKKATLPIVMDPSLRRTDHWGVVAGMGFGSSTMYVDASRADDDVVWKLHAHLCRMCGGGPLCGRVFQSSSSSSPSSSSPSSSSVFGSSCLPRVLRRRCEFDELSVRLSL